MSDTEQDDPITVKTFVYHAQKSGCQQTVSYDVQIPLPDENSRALDYFGHLVAQNKLALPFYEEVKEAFIKFVRDETRKFAAEMDEKRLMAVLNSQSEAEFDVSKLYDRFINPENASPSKTSDEPPFEKQFQHVMRHGTAAQLSLLIREESMMTEEMHKLIRARDFEVERIKRACEVSLANSAANAEQLDKHSFELSMLNEKLRQVSINYSNQIEALCERQRHQYRELVRKLYTNEEIGKAIVPMSISSSSSSGTLGHNLRAGRTFKKSISCDSKMAHNASLLADRHNPNHRSESFTIYIGAQLKTMHNARILVCDRLSDLLTVSHGSTTAGPYDQQSDDSLEDSKRLHLLMNLYRRDLSAVVLIVGRDPLWHVKNGTPFAKQCEQSAELHFDSLETQLKKMEEEVRMANQERRLRRADPSSTPPAYDPLDDSLGYDENTLRPGDVYLTCHSNLSAVQVVFHMVGDRSLMADEISSRHPCIGSLRNIIRLAPHSAVHTITLPLLLVEDMSENMTVNWCLVRAELVYKCLKGFLMEVCSTGSNIAGGASTPEGTAPHFNINFALPSTISSALFQQLVELFSSIFHSVPSLEGH